MNKSDTKINHDLENLYRTSYNRDDCQIGVVHIGYGAFHRAHQAIYIDDYMEKTNDLRWGIAALNLRSEEASNFNQSSQVKDGYIIKTTDTNGTIDYRKVRSHLQYVDGASSPDKAEQLLSNPNVHVITITITESGYYLDGNGNLDTSENTISQEINGEEAQSIYSYLSNALRKRMDTIDQPISILCCDNIRANGKMLQNSLLAYLKATKRNKLSDWITRKVSFPCSMVDRITPRASFDLQQEIEECFGVGDFDPIHSEAFSQWVIEDNFAGLMPDLTKSGAEVVDDVDSYEEAKIRILNGGHTALAYLGALAGHKTFDEAIRNPTLREYFDNFQKQEVLPSLQIELPFDKAEYLQKITDRFCNRSIADQLERICMDGYSKMQLYIKPTLESCLQQDMMPIHTLDCIASWYVYARRYQTGNTSIPYHEPYWEQLCPLLDKGKEKDFTSNTQLWGELPKTYSRFVPTLVEAIERMEQRWPV